MKKICAVDQWNFVFLVLLVPLCFQRGPKYICDDGSKLLFPSLLFYYQYSGYKNLIIINKCVKEIKILNKYYVDDKNNKIFKFKLPLYPL